MLASALVIEDGAGDSAENGWGADAEFGLDDKMPGDEEEENGPTNGEDGNISFAVFVQLYTSFI